MTNPNDQICQRCGKKRSEHWSPNFCFEGSLKDTFLPLAKVDEKAACEFSSANEVLKSLDEDGNCPLCKGTGNIDTDGESVDSLSTQLAEVTKERDERRHTIFDLQEQLHDLYQQRTFLVTQWDACQSKMEALTLENQALREAIFRLHKESYEYYGGCVCEICTTIRAARNKETK